MGPAASLWPASHRSWEELCELADRAERGPWCGLWLADHLWWETAPGVVADDDCLDAWTMLPALAARTSSIRLGPLVAPVTFRHPATLAAAAVGLDHVSGGRFVLGVGAGWQRFEHEAHGFPLGTQRERSDRFESACGVIVGLLGDGVGAPDDPWFPTIAPGRRPAVRHGVPLLVGGRGERRTLRTAARFADEWNGWCDADALRAKLAVLAAHGDDVGRDTSPIRCSTNTYVALADRSDDVARLAAAAAGRPCVAGSVDEVVEGLAALGAAGADEVVIVDWNLDDPVERAEVLDRLAIEVLPQLD